MVETVLLTSVWMGWAELIWAEYEDICNAVFFVTSMNSKLYFMSFPYFLICTVRTEEWTVSFRKVGRAEKVFFYGMEIWTITCIMLHALWLKLHTQKGYLLKVENSNDVQFYAYHWAPEVKFAGLIATKMSQCFWVVFHLLYYNITML